jgi:hypothetical protein
LAKSFVWDGDKDGFRYNSMPVVDRDAPRIFHGQSRDDCERPEAEKIALGNGPEN